MAITDFERYPLTVRAEPDPPAATGSARTWAGRRSGPSGRTSIQRPRVRRQQDPQAGVPRAGRAGAGRGHPGLHRRRTSPTTPARSRRWPPSSASRPGWSRRTGSTGRTRSPTESATSCCRASWVPTSGWTAAGFDIGIQQQLGAARSTRCEAAAASPYAIPAGASDHRLGGLGLRQLGLRGGAAGTGARHLLRHDHRLHRDGFDPRRDDRRLRRPGQAAPGDRHRRLGHTASRPGPRLSGSPGTPPS